MLRSYCNRHAVISHLDVRVGKVLFYLFVQARMVVRDMRYRKFRLAVARALIAQVFFELFVLGKIHVPLVIVHPHGGVHNYAAECFTATLYIGKRFGKRIAGIHQIQQGGFSVVYDIVERLFFGCMVRFERRDLVFARKKRCER